MNNKASEDCKWIIIRYGGEDIEVPVWGHKPKERTVNDQCNDQERVEGDQAMEERRPEREGPGRDSTDKELKFVQHELRDTRRRINVIERKMDFLFFKNNSLDNGSILFNVWNFISVHGRQPTKKELSQLHLERSLSLLEDSNNLPRVASRDEGEVR